MTGCIVKRVTSVEPHPEADATHLSVIRTGADQFVSLKLDGGVHRYSVGDAVVHIPDGAILPLALMKRLDVWDEEAGRGMLKGSLGNRVKAGNFRRCRSDGMLLPVAEVPHGPHAEGADVSDVLGVEFAPAN